MQAVKVFNNNAVSVVMPDGREAILVGNGLGFGRRPGFCKSFEHPYH